MNVSVETPRSTSCVSMLWFLQWTNSIDLQYIEVQANVWVDPPFWQIWKDYININSSHCWLTIGCEIEARQSKIVSGCANKYTHMRPLFSKAGGGTDAQRKHLYASAWLSSHLWNMEQPVVFFTSRDKKTFFQTPLLRYLEQLIAKWDSISQFSWWTWNGKLKSHNFYWKWQMYNAGCLH